MPTEIKGKSIRKCSNCHKANPFSKEYCPIRTEEIELYLDEHPDPSDIYGLAKMKAQNHVGDIIREEGFCPFDSRYIETPLSILNGICLHELEYSTLKDGETISKSKWEEMARITRSPQSWQYVEVGE